VRLIAHISDLHFGAEDPVVVERLLFSLAERRPDLVVVSGDLTQRARVAQFRAADAFLKRVEAEGLPVLVVPGNHDVPLYDLFRRFLSPLGRYCRIIAKGRDSWFHDGEIAVLGLHSARSLTIKHGRLTRMQIAEIERCFAGLPHDTSRLLVTHHPLVELPDAADGDVHRAARRGDRAVAVARAAHVHLLLAGHHHAAHVDLSVAKRSADRSLLVVQAGTATSVRRRGEANSYNLIRLSQGVLVVEVMTSEDGGRFQAAATHEYRLDENGWQPPQRMATGSAAADQS
jgi:3',5'-cyclic AMP phosphodiesterase CpdA